MRWVWPSASQNGSGKVSATFSNWPNPRRLIAPRFLGGRAGREPDPLGLEHAEGDGDQHVRAPQRAVAPAAAREVVSTPTRTPEAVWAIEVTLWPRWTWVPAAIALTSR